MNGCETTVRPLLIAGPSGVGKGTLVERLRTSFPNAFGYSISCTSRNQRSCEKEGIHYFFVTKETFCKGIENKQFLEYAEICGNLYGTPISELDRIQKEGKICLLEIDLQGVRQIQQSPLSQKINYVFIRPPSIQALVERLKKRGTEKQEETEKRIELAQHELKESQQLKFDTILVNDDIDICYTALEDQIITWYPFLKNQQ